MLPNITRRNNSGKFLADEISQQWARHPLKEGKMGVQGIVLLSLFQIGTFMDLARRSSLNMKQNKKMSNKEFFKRKWILTPYLS